MSSPSLFSDSAWFVDVAVPVPLRQVFTYRLPKGIDPQKVDKGYRALVPFGPRLLHGITMSAAHQHAQTKGRMRTLVTLDLKHRVLSTEITQLVEWMVAYYRSPVGEVIKLALPPGILGKPNLCFRLTETGRTHIDLDPDARLLRLLELQPLTKKTWEMKAQAEISQKQIRAWEDAGFLEILSELPQKEAIPHVPALSLTAEGKEIDPTHLTRARKQQKILRWLQQHARRDISQKELTSTFPNATPILKTFEEKGWIDRKQLPAHQINWEEDAVEKVAPFTLTSEQQEAFTAIQIALTEKTYTPFLMFGVTGAGKTEVYLRAISHCLRQGRQALFLVPEIALTPLMQRRIVDRFGERLAILHSAVGASQRSKAWSKVLAGKVEVVLGARSGIFAPLPRLGLIIVDEEHDTSYKQHDGVRYHARDLALVRAKMADATIILGSATPSLESWHNHERGKFKLLTLRQRATRATLPEVTVVDMREEFQAQRKRPLFSRELLKQLQASIEQGQQAMILLNRRGFHSFLLCRKCGETMNCSHCEVSLTFHRTEGRLKCHYCEETRQIPTDCPQCAAPAAMMQFFGEGTQQVQEALAKHFPNVTIDRLDRDQLTRKDAHRQILKRFEKEETQILVGTQMIAKGHDFPNVTCVGIINADQGLRMPDFRCAEHAFQLITQVAGRSGRGTSPGKVVIQTYMPEHYSIRCAAKHDFEAFLKKEMRYRRHLFYPPFSHTLHLLVQDKQGERAWQAIHWIVEQIKARPESRGFVILGPTKAPIGRIKDIFRFQLLIKSAHRPKLHALTDQVVEAAIGQNLIPRTSVILDIDPHQFS